MTWQGVEMEIQVPCAEGKQHPVRLRFTGWGEYEVVHNPCEELLGAVFARMAPCTHYLREQFPEEFRQDARFRKQLVEALGAVGTPAVPHLIQALGDEDEDVREAACRALGEIGDGQAVPALSVWAHAGGRVAQAALQQMGQAPLPLPEAVAQVVAQGAWGVLVRALPHEAVRAAVVELGTPAVPHLIQALGDRDRDVRKAACRALGAIGDRQAVPPLIQALRDWYVREAACEALGAIGDRQAVPHLIQALGDGNSVAFMDWDRDVRKAACWALGEIGDRQAVPPLIQALRDWNRDVRAAACWALVKIGAPAVPHLIQALGDGNEDVRAAACWALVKIGAPAVPHLIQALGDGNEDVRAAACWALVKIGAPAVPHLIQALGDGDWYVRAAACEALVEIGAPAVPHLIQALGDGNEDVRVAAC
jgi:HEAT repeat protein